MSTVLGVAQAGPYGEVLKLQSEGDKAATAAFFERWTQWKPELHEKLAARIVHHREEHGEQSEMEERGPGEAAAQVGPRARS